MPICYICDINQTIERSSREWSEKENFYSRTAWRILREGLHNFMNNVTSFESKTQAENDQSSVAETSSKLSEEEDTVDGHPWGC